MADDAILNTLAGYHAELATHPAPARRVGWRNAAEQRLRFEACLSALPLHRVRSVLDVGCGLGDLAATLRHRGFTGAYLGVDLLPSMINAASARFPNERFVCGDLTREPSLAPGPFDLVVACGTLSLRVPDYAAHFHALIDAMWERTHRALALLVPSHRARRHTVVERGAATTFVYHRAERLRAHLASRSPWITLREDALPTDLIAYLYRHASPLLDALEDAGELPPEDLAALFLDRELPEDALRLIAQHDDANARVCLLRGQALRQLGREAEARAALERALELDPSMLAARLTLDAL